MSLTHTRSLAFSATQDSQSKPNTSFMWNVSTKTDGSLKVEVNFGVDEDVSGSGRKSDSITIGITKDSEDPVSISGGTAKGDVKISGYVQAIWGGSSSWIVLFTNGSESKSSDGHMLRGGFVNIYQCLASGTSDAVNGIIVGASIPSL
ncbi:hypothetical protein L2755_05920 [Shewanella abyssi]|uniref:hypothetical protein n=1 Tax=Shewanella abyssi TaxID=311789 RepID=UPI00200DA7EB|nr:hypothetical protein [Shewanella abyssi]MCL1049160.1 hypothetical protein [Shewanella abyssi]